MMDVGPDSLGDGTDDLPRWRRFVPFVLAFVFAAALAILIYRADHAADMRDRAIALQRHSYQVMMQAKTVEAKVGNAETLLARYVVSHDDAVGRQYQDEWATAMRELVALERATRNSPAKRAVAENLRKAMVEREATLKEIALRVRYDQSLGALGQLEATRKEASVKAIADALQRLVSLAEAERIRRNLQVDRSRSQVDQLNDSYGLMGLGMFIAAVVALWFTNSALNERVFARRLAAAEAARVDGLEAAVQQRTEQLREANERLYQEMEERVQAEQSLRQLQKMEALGALTGGIAHDFNNMLAVVIGGIDVARRQIARDPDKAVAHLDSAIEGANHAAALIERLLAFARAEPLLPDRIAVDTLLTGMEDLVARAIGTGIKVEFVLDAPDWAVWADRAQMESALINMAINARDAMDGRGTLRIVTQAVTLSEYEIGQCAAGDHVSLTVSDTGCGMSPAILERAFEPFFTTKTVGKGTGLGMSQIFGFVTQCRGAVDIKSVENEGTSIRLLLPRLPESATQPEPRQERAANVPSAQTPLFPENDTGLTVLVVEDDERVLRSTIASLGALGHQCIACDHPAKAQAILAERPDISIILSDVLMPDMTGPEMIRSIGASIGNRAVIFVTGFAGDKDTAAQIAGYPIVRKPFTMMQLGAAIDQAVADKRSHETLAQSA